MSDEHLDYVPEAPLPPIEKCAYLIRKGEKPRADRGNIFAYRESLAMKPNKFEPFRGKLPELTTKVFGKSTVGALKPDPLKNVNTVEPTEDDLKQVLLFTAFDNLEPADIGGKGFPLLERVRAISGIDDLSAETLRSSWAEYKEANKSGRE
jgi:hypothetical protein